VRRAARCVLSERRAFFPVDTEKRWRSAPTVGHFS
jgi:hypothetical protein